jgi:primary-amine oxidase
MTQTSVNPRGDTGPAAVHPLAALTASEITTVTDLLRTVGALDDQGRVLTVSLVDPGRRALAEGTAVRMARAVVAPGPEPEVDEVDVRLDGTPTVVSRRHLSGVRPVLSFEESVVAIDVLQHHPDWIAAMHRRGITDLDQVQIDPWPAGSLGNRWEEGRRLCRCLAYWREDPADNGYARPIEGVIGFVDMGRAEVLEVLDLGVVPLPPGNGRYRAADVATRPPLAPLHITQPDGPGFTVDGNLVRFGPWSLRVTMDPLEGLVLHTVTYDDHGRCRRVLHRASISEMVVPYGDPGPLHGWKSAFDAGEWGLGRMTNSLALGCDCLGEIRYLDAAFANERGGAYVVPNAICLHEEDFGMLWKHVDHLGAGSEVRRSRRLVLNHVATVGNYDYGFSWYLYLDGTIELQVKLTGILSTMAIPPGAPAPPYASPIAPQLAAPVHQHLFCARLHMDIDGADATVVEVDAVADPPGPDNPWANAFRAVETPLRTERQARRRADPLRSRTWHVRSTTARNALGRPTAYKLVPGPNPVLLADATAPVARRAGFATEHLWVTVDHPAERRAAGDHPNQYPGTDGLARWTEADRPVADADVVLWHTFGVTHVPRPEDWPVMPVEMTGFHLVPAGFFDGNPALDLAPPDTSCHSHPASGSPAPEPDAAGPAPTSSSDLST